MMNLVRGIRGATTAAENSSEAVLSATKELLTQLVAENSIEISHIASVFFTGTPDITSVFPAKAAREMGWNSIPLMCFQEMNVTGSLPLCIRVLVLVNTSLSQQEIKHIYLHGAKVLRQDLT